MTLEINYNFKKLEKSEGQKHATKQATSQYRNQRRNEKIP